MTVWALSVGLRGAHGVVRVSQIFINDDQSSEAYPRDRVVAHLQQFAPSLRIRYLEHIINSKDPRRQEKNPALHNMLLAHYVDVVMADIRQANGGELVEGRWTVDRSSAPSPPPPPPQKKRLALTSPLRVDVAG